MTIAQKFGTYIANLKRDDLPPEVDEAVRGLLLYNLTVALSGYAPNDHIWQAITVSQTPQGQATLWPNGASRSASDAAFANAALVTARGQNDTLLEVQAHMGCVCIPAALTLAETRGASPDDVIAAVVAGYECQIKLSREAVREAGRRGLRATSLFGVLGAAASAARIIGLDEARTANALAIATNFAGGLKQCWVEASEEWRLQIAHTAEAGVRSALLAEMGIRGASRALEGEAGFYAAFSDGIQPPPPDFTAHDILKVTIKPYPGCAANQSIIHALVGLLYENDIGLSDVERITAQMAPPDFGYPGVQTRGPFATTGGAVMSAAFMLAATLRDGAPSHRVLRDEFSCGDLHDIADRVDVCCNEKLTTGQACLTIHLRSGRKLSKSTMDDSDFRPNWEEMRALTGHIAEDWPCEDAPHRHADLTEILAEFRDPASVAAVLDACRIATGAP